MEKTKINSKKITEIIHLVHKAIDDSDMGPVYVADMVDNRIVKNVNPLGIQMFVTTLNAVLQNIDKVDIDSMPESYIN